MSNIPLSNYYSIFSPSTPNYAKLKSNELHLYSFATLFVRSKKGWFSGVRTVHKLPPQLEGIIYAVGHVTDKRIVFEPLILTEKQQQAIERERHFGDFFKGVNSLILSQGVKALMSPLLEGEDGGDEIYTVTGAESQGECLYLDLSELIYFRPSFGALFPSWRSDSKIPLPIIKPKPLKDTEIQDLSPSIVMWHLLNDLLLKIHGKELAQETLNQAQAHQSWGDKSGFEDLSLWAELIELWPLDSSFLKDTKFARKFVNPGWMD